MVAADSRCVYRQSQCLYASVVTSHIEVNGVTRQSVNQVRNVIKILVEKKVNCPTTLTETQEGRGIAPTHS
jgi:hypothetical protein